MAENKGFDLAAVLGAVPDLGTNPSDREQIEYIDIDKLDADAKNFYAISGVDELAANISMFGLQQPIRVRATENGRFTIVSGHRRHAALRKLVDDGSAEFAQVPCIRERGEGSAALQELRLIFANSDTRRMTSSDISKQAERVEALLYQLKEEGYEFPGRMRDHVAEACKVSKSKLARLKVIRDNLAEEWTPHYEKGDLSESTAYTLAQLKPEYQKKILARRRPSEPIRWLTSGEVERFGEYFSEAEKISCKKDGGIPCDNLHRMCDKIASVSSWQNPCAKCCDKCDYLASCKYACPKLAEKVQKMKSDENERRRQEKRAREESERPTIERIQKFWTRFGEARRAAQMSWARCCKEMQMGEWALGGKDGVSARERGNDKIDVNTTLPYGYSCYLNEVKRIIDIADLFGCSLDYLLCRTDEPKSAVGAAASAPAEGWIPLQWLSGKEKPVKEGQLAVAGFMVPGMDAPMRSIVCWNGTGWVFPAGDCSIDAECVGWFPLPEEESDANS